MPICIINNLLYTDHLGCRYTSRNPVEFLGVCGLCNGSKLLRPTGIASTACRTLMSVSHGGCAKCITGHLIRCYIAARHAKRTGHPTIAAASPDFHPPIVSYTRGV
uniref:Uncharacterized protein n=1 Tax=Bactrocera latifrons TaxID=174628 RepID=A0A0K8WEK4_BACLA